MFQYIKPADCSDLQKAKNIYVLFQVSAPLLFYFTKIFYIDIAFFTKFPLFDYIFLIQVTLFISKSRVPDKILRDISSWSSVTSFTIFMYVELQLARKQLAHCLYILKTPVINACFACRFLKSICNTHLSTWHSFSSTSVTFVVYIKERR